MFSGQFCSPWPRALSRPGHVAATRKSNGKHAAHTGALAQWSVQGEQLKDGWLPGVRLRV